MLASLLFVLVPLLVVYLVREAHYRRFKQYAAFPQLESSYLWGHLNMVIKLISRGAERRHVDYAFREMKELLGNPPLMFVDFRPVSYGMCIITNHEVAEQISRNSKLFPWSVPKSPTLSDLLPVIGTESILTREGEEWKALRRKFNPGFAPKHLLGCSPCILDKTWHFLHHLDSYAVTGEVFSLDELCVNLTFDIIGAVTMDVDLDAQLDKARQSELIRLYRRLTRTYTGAEARVPYLTRLRRRMTRGRLSRRIDNLIEDLIKDRFAEMKRQEMRQGASPKSRSVLYLTLRDIDVLTPTVLSQSRDQLKTFLFAGHDTTSILLQWILYELSRTPRALAAARAELDAVFGPDPDPAVVRDTLLAGGEDLAGRMSYVSAIVKETLRLYPPAGTARMAPPGSGLTVRMPRTGADICLDGVIIYSCASLIQRDRAVYGDNADDFVPERWLGNTDTSMGTDGDGGGDDGSALQSAASSSSPSTLQDQKESRPVPPSAWRPFERGPRNCIGQELANLEVRVILACSLRRYDFTKVGLGESVVDEKGQPVMGHNGQYKVESELYNTSQVTSKPVDGTMMKVKLTPKASTQLR